MHCDDLTREEHNALRSLSASRNKRTNIVRAGHGDHIPKPHIDALLELAIIERVGDTYRVVRPCPGHSVSPVTRDDAEEPEPRSGRRYTSAGGVPSTGRVLGGSDGRDGRIAEGSCVRNDDKVSRAFDKARKAANARLVKYFFEASRVHHWTAKPTQQGRIALAANMKQWLLDGATEDEIRRMIDKFFIDIRGQSKGGHVWKMFIIRRATIDIDKETETDDMKENRDDSDYWSSTKEVQERKREQDGEAR